jgi:hypothetical protein
MGQLGFFDADKRLEAFSAKGDPLEVIDRLVPWESFRAEVEAVVLTSDELKKSSAGRKPFDALLMFRMLVLARTARPHARLRTPQEHWNIPTMLSCDLLAIGIGAFGNVAAGTHYAARPAHIGGGWIGSPPSQK